MKFESAVFCIDTDCLSFADFSSEDVDAEGVENFFLDCALERPRAVNRVVSFPGEQFLGRIGQIKRDLLLLEPFGEPAQLDFNDLLKVISRPTSCATCPTATP